MLRSDLARRIILALAIVVSAAGGWISYALALKHFKAPVATGEPRNLFDRTCEATPATSCDTALKSPWGTFPFGQTGAQKKGIPTAELGLWFFVCVLCWLVFVGRASPSRWWAHLILTAGVVMGLGSSLFFEYIMWFKMDRWCPLCLATHVACLLLFVFTLLLRPWETHPLAEGSPGGRKSGRAAVAARCDPALPRASEALFDAPVSASIRAAREKGPWPDTRALVLTPLIAVVLIVAVHYRLQTEGAAEQIKQKGREAKYHEDQLKFFDRWEHTYTAWTVAPQVDISPKDAPTRGPADARHTVFIFSDFACPSCKPYEEWFAKTILPLGAKHGGLRVYFRHWPICQDCNSHATTNLHPTACKAAQAAEAAHVVGGDDAFWKMHDLLFERQSQWTARANLLPGYGKEIGLDQDAFLRAMDSPLVMDRIKASIAEGATLGEGTLSPEEQQWTKVNSTPSVFVDGKRLRNPRHFRAWLSILQLPPARGPAGGSAAGRPVQPTVLTTRPAIGSGTRPAPVGPSSQ